MRTASALGPFQMPPGHELVVALPGGSETQEGWVGNCQKKWWSGKRTAHLFDDEWSMGTYQGDEKKDGEPVFCFFYRELKMKYTHGLSIEEHCLTKIILGCD